MARVLVAGALALGLLAAPAAGFAQGAGMPDPGTIRLKVAEFDPVAGVHNSGLPHQQPKSHSSTKPQSTQD